jgi:hypothetical protein
MQDEAVLGLPRARRELVGDRERRVALGLRVVVAEVVHELLDAHGVLRRELALVRKRRTLAYEAVSTSIEKVESGFWPRPGTALSTDAVVGLCVELGPRGLQLRQELLARDGGELGTPPTTPPAIPPGTPPSTPPATPVATLRSADSRVPSSRISS